MYLHRIDPVEGLAVWVFQDATPAEWQTHFDQLRDLATWSGKIGKRAAALLVSRGGRPDARGRAELARLTEAPGYDPYIAFVTPSLALRAALMMFGWVQRAPKYEMSSFDSSREALLWLEKRRGARLESMEAMLVDVRAVYRSETGAELP